jgi:hypothetical protein
MMENSKYAVSSFQDLIFGVRIRPTYRLSYEPTQSDLYGTDIFLVGLDDRRA